jgi:hypothetical protein
MRLFFEHKPLMNTIVMEIAAQQAQILNFHFQWRHASRERRGGMPSTCCPWWTLSQIQLIKKKNRSMDCLHLQSKFTCWEKKWNSPPQLGWSRQGVGSWALIRKLGTHCASYEMLRHSHSKAGVFDVFGRFGAASTQTGHQIRWQER